MSPTLSDADIARFWTKVAAAPGGCIVWTKGLSSSGYGRFCLGKHYKYQAHRVAYELARGPIPAGLVLDHLCCVRRCVNHLHLEPVTHKENILRGEGLAAKNALKTHCPAGHEYNAENTYHFKRSETRVGRNCLPCERARYIARAATPPRAPRTSIPDATGETS